MTPLDGVLVVSIEQAVAAPLATRHLADLGARVIKIERPDEGDFARHYDTTVKGQSSYFVWLNRSKESLTLDLKRPGAAKILARLLERADVFVQNLGPGAADRLGTSPSALAQRYPRLVVCSVSGYGTTGPYATRKAYDLLVQSETGVVALTGPPDHPSRVGLSIADIAAGMYAYSGILTALIARRAHGRGTTLEVSLFDALAEWMGAPALATAGSGHAPARTGPHHATIAPYGPFAVRGGRQVVIGIQNAREWERFCRDVLGQPGLAHDTRFDSNPKRVAHRDALHAIVDAVFGQLDEDGAVARLEAAGIAWARLNSVADFVHHPQLSERSRWTEIATPGGAVRVVRPPVQDAGTEPVMGAVPALGEHTDAILHELGFEAGRVAAWRKEGTI